METIKPLMGQAAEWLPLVTCIALWDDVAPARDRTKDSSFLTVIWYQDEFAMPIDDLVLGQLRAIDWENVATDEEY